MDKKEINIALKAVMNARDIIGILGLSDGKHGYDDFEDEHLRDIYYKLNDICIDLLNNKKYGGKRNEYGQF